MNEMNKPLLYHYDYHFSQYQSIFYHSFIIRVIVAINPHVHEKGPR